MCVLKILEYWPVKIRQTYLWRDRFGGGGGGIGGSKTAQQERLQGPNSKGTVKKGNYRFNELGFHEACKKWMISVNWRSCWLHLISKVAGGGEELMPQQLSMPELSSIEKERRYTLLRDKLKAAGLSALIVYGGTQLGVPVHYLTRIWGNKNNMVIFPVEGEPVFFNTQQ